MVMLQMYINITFLEVILAIFIKYLKKWFVLFFPFVPVISFLGILTPSFPPTVGKNLYKECLLQHYIKLKKKGTSSQYLIIEKHLMIGNRFNKYLINNM